MNGNGYKLAAQQRRAQVFSLHLFRFDIRADEVCLISDAQWAQIGQVLNMRPPSGETVALIEDSLKRLESAAAAKENDAELFARMYDAEVR
jgi:hypothetical protein